MRISLNWLADYINLDDLSPQEVANHLTSIGLEVEGIEDLSPFSNEVVVGEILEAIPHPNADSLRLCTVSVGSGDPLPIVCGAPNARKGIRVAVAQVGCVLPGDFKIKKSKIRGETSMGMLCSGKELGVSDDHEGILELSEKFPLGMSAGKALGLADAILEVNVTPNRGDCLSYIGIARDLAAKLRRPVRKTNHEYQIDTTIASTEMVKVDIADTSDCSRFVALTFKDIPNTSSPAWMQRRLEASGMRAISLTVDISNYVMLETGQPNHAYDLDKLGGQLLRVRRAQHKETLITLDETKRQLLEDQDLLITDEEGPVGLAGIMGGDACEVSEKTKQVVLEVACFSAIPIRQSAKRHVLHTEASHRFERGVNIESISFVAQRFAALLWQCSTELNKQDRSIPLPKIARDLVDIYPNPPSKKVITLRLSRVKELLALPHLAAQDITDILTSLDFDLIDHNKERFVFDVPFWRNDIEREIDLVEEIARIHGYDKIPTSLPAMNIRPTPEDPFLDFCDKVRGVIAGNGLSETISFPFTDQTKLKKMRISESHPSWPSVKLANALNADQPWLQTSLIPNLLEATQQNRRKGSKAGALFEIGRSYFDFNVHPLADDQRKDWQSLARPGRFLTLLAKDQKNRPTERIWLSAIFDQPKLTKSWGQPVQAWNFYDVKDILYKLAHSIQLGPVKLEPVKNTLYPFLHPAASCCVFISNKRVGYLGELHPETALAWDLFDQETKTSPFVIELDLEMLYSCRQAHQYARTESYRFPPVSRDVALLMPLEFTHEQVVQAMKQSCKSKVLKHIELFDVYSGDRLPAGKKSMAYTLVFQSPEGTLNDKDIDPQITHMLKTLQEKYEITQR